MEKRVLGMCIAVAAVLLLLDNGGELAPAAVWCIATVAIILANILVWSSESSDGQPK